MQMACKWLASGPQAAFLGLRPAFPVKDNLPRFPYQNRGHSHQTASTKLNSTSAWRTTGNWMCIFSRSALVFHHELYHHRPGAVRIVRCLVSARRMQLRIQRRNKMRRCLSE